ncbi:MAG: tetratricopeptide repeat protein [Spirochaetes bacterium]|nr:tetratricopeptide repeat protein [Spirochaetota bacterium]
MFSLGSIVVISIIVILGASLLFFLISGGGSKDEDKKKKTRTKNEQALIKEAYKKLAQNPRDPEALRVLAGTAFSKEDYETAFKYYKILIDLCAMHSEINEFDVTLKYAISAMKLKNLTEAYKSFMIARSMNKENFEINYNLGYLEFLRKNYEKSTPLLKKALILKPEHPETIRYLAHSLYRVKKYSDAIRVFKKLLEYEPENKDALFILGQCFYELGQHENALKIFQHLRTNPKLGAAASLMAGTLRIKQKQYESAVLDFEIGLKHENGKHDILLELKYRLAGAYLQSNKIEEALEQWKAIRRQEPRYKDVNDLIKKYEEISANKNLQVYLLSSNSEFVGLCRRIATNFFPDAVTRLTNISLHKSEYADILAEVSTRKWEDTVLFRFIRGTGIIGELMLRDLYARMKEIKAARGICITTGTFSEGAKDFVTARLIDLIDNPELLKIFNRLPKAF